MSVDPYRPAGQNHFKLCFLVNLFINILVIYF